MGLIDFRKRLWFVCIFLFIASYSILPLLSIQAQGRTCGVDWYDTSTDPYTFLYNERSEDLCNYTDPLLCPPGSGVAGNIATGNMWCAGGGIPDPPPNYPGINAGQACLAGSSRTVTITPTGDTHELQISPGNQIIALSGNSHTFNNLQQDVDYRFRAQAENSGGSSGWSSWTGIVRHDLTAPTTTLDLVGTAGSNNWWQSVVSVTLPATDSGCLGVSDTFYTLDSVASTYSGAAFEVSGDGTHDLSYYSTDGSYDEVSQSTTISIDTVVPTLSLTTDRASDSNNGWWTSPVTITVVGDDVTSGVDTLDTNHNSTGWTVYSAPITLSTDGTHNLDARVIDVAGWETVDGIVILIDTSAPTLYFTFDREPDRNGWYNDSVSVGVESADATSGVSGTVARLVYEGTWRNYTGAYLIGGDGEHLFEAVVTDIAGNVTARQVTVPIDVTPPTTTLTWDGETLDISVTDNRSGVMGTTLTINGVVTPYTGEAIEFEIVGDYSIEVYSTDMAGNDEAAQVLNITYDPTAPSATTSTLSTPTLEADLTCSDDRYDVTGFASATSGLSAVYLLAQPDSGDAFEVSGSRYSYNPASTEVEAFSFYYASNDEFLTVVAEDVSGGERRLELNCPSDELLFVPVSTEETNPNTDYLNQYPASLGDMSSDLDALVQPFVETGDSSSSQSNTNTPITSNYVAPDTRVTVIEPTSPELTIVEGNPSPLSAQELATILSMTGLLATTTAAVGLQVTETARRRREELEAERLETEQQRQAGLEAQAQRARENVEMNAQMRQDAQKEVILEVEISEAYKKWQAHVDALMAEYHTRMERGQSILVVREINEQVDPLVELVETNIVNLGGFLTGEEKKELRDELLLLKDAQQVYDVDALISSAEKISQIANKNFGKASNRAEAYYREVAEAQAAQAIPQSGAIYGDSSLLDDNRVPYPPGMNSNTPLLIADENMSYDDTVALNKAIHYRNYLRNQYGVDISTGENQLAYQLADGHGWSLGEIYSVYNGTARTGDALYTNYWQNPPIQGIIIPPQNSGEAFKIAVGPVEIRRSDTATETQVLWRDDTDSNLIILPSDFFAPLLAQQQEWTHTSPSVGRGQRYTESISGYVEDPMWEIVRAYGNALDNRSFEFATQQLMLNGVQDTNGTTISGITTSNGLLGTLYYALTPEDEVGQWETGSEGLYNLIHQGGPLGDSSDSPSPQDEWSLMFAQWVYYNNFAADRRTQGWDEISIQLDFIDQHDLLRDANFDWSDGMATTFDINSGRYSTEIYEQILEHYILTLDPDFPHLHQMSVGAKELYLDNLLDDLGIPSFAIEQSPDIPQAAPEPNESFRSLYNRLLIYDSLVEQQALPTFFDRIARTDAWIAASVANSVLWRDINFQANILANTQFLDIQMANTPLLFSRGDTPEEGQTVAVTWQDVVNNDFYGNPFLSEMWAEYQGLLSAEQLTPTDYNRMVTLQRNFLFYQLLPLSFGGTTPQALQLGEDYYGAETLTLEAVKHRFSPAIHALSNNELAALLNLYGTSPFDSEAWDEWTSLQGDFSPEAVAEAQLDPYGEFTPYSEFAEVSLETPHLLQALWFLLNFTPAGPLVDVIDTTEMALNGNFIGVILMLLTAGNANWVDEAGEGIAKVTIHTLDGIEEVPLVQLLMGNYDNLIEGTNQFSLARLLNGMENLSDDEAARLVNVFREVIENGDVSSLTRFTNLDAETANVLFTRIADPDLAFDWNVAQRILNNTNINDEALSVVIHADDEVLELITSNPNYFDNLPSNADNEITQWYIETWEYNGRATVSDTTNGNASVLRGTLYDANRLSDGDWDWRVPQEGEHAHHIIPARHRQFEVLRSNLEDWGININSAFNGVGLDGNIHLRLHNSHTSEYFMALVDALDTATSREEALNVLEQVARQINELNNLPQHIIDNPDLLDDVLEELIDDIGTIVPTD